MRHNNKTKSLGRKAGHRRALLANLASSLIEHKRINTTLAKGKVLRTYVEPLLTRAKTDTTHSRRVVFSYLQNKEVVAELFRDVAPKIADRPGGYTRVIKTGTRKGDGAEMCMIELVDYNEIYGAETKKKTTRRRRKKSDDTATKATEAKAAVVEDAEVVEETKVEETKAVAKEETPVAKADSNEEGKDKD
ncbi:50S ribosomal protein L17 [Salibacteraceae bacterium]|jgi:large subunit ribosomal protein L17|nr:50S ribosomal protein L17 [Crocinitomicaceae bacterium]MDB9725802.1 50S ribosomal protein L17 [Salibacteraceae bacterium]|tara:strand:+ start:16106 stop:16678 length:573 start_codon:yes stop_codon:yes gene_type:complete